MNVLAAGRAAGASGAGHTAAVYHYTPARRRPLERQRRFPLECGRGRLEEHEHLGGALKGERLDAGGDGAESSDKGLTSRSDRGERVGKGSGMGGI